MNDFSQQGRLVVIGVGNRDRGDDGIGPAIIDGLSRRVGEDVITLVREGDLAVLPLLWDSDDDVVIIDATMTSGPIGELREIDPDHLKPSDGMSTHGLDVADAIRLAGRLDWLPARLRVFGVSGRDFGHGPMSATLQSLVEPLTEELMGYLGLNPGAGSIRPHGTPHRAQG